MKILSLLFGEWVTIQEGIGKVGYISFTGREWEEQVGVTIERHTRTNKERAFIHRLDGRKQKTSLEVAKSLHIPEVSL